MHRYIAFDHVVFSRYGYPALSAAAELRSSFDAVAKMHVRSATYVVSKAWVV